MVKNILRPLDVLLTILVGAAIVFISIQVYRVDGLPDSVSIKSESGLSLYPLNQAHHIEVHGPIGTTIIEINDKHARVVSSPCRDKLCILKGILKENGDWTACMPNRIYVGIEGKKKEKLDEISY